MNPDSSLRLSPVMANGSSFFSGKSPNSKKKNVHYSIDSYDGSYLTSSTGDRPQHSTPIKNHQNVGRNNYSNRSNVSQSTLEESPGISYSSSRMQRKFNSNDTLKSKDINNASIDTSPRSNFSFEKKSFMLDLEQSTVEKQHKELQLLIEELQQRDRELNDMVSAHQKQLLAWEDDRQRVLALQQRTARLERMLQQKSDDYRNVSTKLKISESEENSKSTVLRNTQDQLVKITEQHSNAVLKLRELQDENKGLNESIDTVESNMQQLKIRENELLATCKTKDKDLRSAASHITQLTSKLKVLDQQQRESQSTTSDIRWQVSEWKQKYIDTRKEMEKLNKQLFDHKQETEDEKLELVRLRQENSDLKKELFSAGERDRRNMEFIESQRSSQERLKSELTSVRQLYERQQREVLLLRLNAASAEETQPHSDEGLFTQTQSSGVYSFDSSQFTNKFNEFSKTVPHTTSTGSNKSTTSDRSAQSQSYNPNKLSTSGLLHSSENRGLQHMEHSNSFFSSSSRSNSANESRSSTASNFNQRVTTPPRKEFSGSCRTNVKPVDEEMGVKQESPVQYENNQIQSLERDKKKSSKSLDDKVDSDGNDSSGRLAQRNVCGSVQMNNNTSQGKINKSPEYDDSYSQKYHQEDIYRIVELTNKEIGNPNYHVCEKAKLILNGGENIDRLKEEDISDYVKTSTPLRQSVRPLPASDHLVVMNAKDSFVTQIPDSPASKLFKLLQESREMVENLEKS